MCGHSSPRPFKQFAILVPTDIATRRDPEKQGPAPNGRPENKKGLRLVGDRSPQKYARQPALGVQGKGPCRFKRLSSAVVPKKRPAGYFSATLVPNAFRTA